MNARHPARAGTRLIAVAALLLAWVVACHASGQPAPPRDSRYVLQLEPFAEHAGENAIDLTHAGDGSGRLFVSTQSGQVFVFNQHGNRLGVFLDIAAADVGFTRTRGSFNGLMYIAFHPDYARPGAPGEGLIYTGHQVAVDEQVPDFDSRDFGGLGDSDIRFMLAEWRVDPDNPNRIDPASHRRVMLIHFRTYAQNPHALGELAFNPYAEPGEADYGRLYVAVGDSHSGDYSQPTNLARVQQPDNPFAKILRIDPLQRDGQPYTIPEDNPFGTEAYALGLRDAQSFSFARDFEGQPVIVAFDIGAMKVEEVNLVRAGGNYGWDRYEGTLGFDNERQVNGVAIPPAAQYGRIFQRYPGAEPSGGPAAIIGGLVVSDPDHPGFRGQILFGDLPRGTLMHVNYHHALSVEAEGGQSIPYVMQVRLGDRTGSFADVINADRGDTRFGFDEAGNVYIVSKQTGTIFRTGLVYTGLPVESQPRVAKSGGAQSWAIGVILGVCVGLLLIVAMVLLARRRSAET